MVNWRGQEVTDKVLRNSARAMDSVMADCVATAKRNVRRRTTALQGSIQYRPTVHRPDGLVGFWGSFDIHYAIYVEKGTKPHWPPIDAIAKGLGVSRSVAFLIARSISRKGTKAYPYLVPAAEEFYPDLKRRIKVG